LKGFCIYCFVGDDDMSRVKLVLLTVLAIGIAGCSRTGKETTEQQPPAAQQPATPPVPAPAPESTTQVAQPEPAKAAPTPRQTVKPSSTAKTAQAQGAPAAAVEQQPAAAPSIAASAPPVQRQMEAAQPPKPKEPTIVTIPSGTSLHIRLQDPLDSAVNKSGDVFHAILDQDVDVNGKVIAARGSALQGKLSSVAQSGRVEGRAAMALQITGITLAGQTYPIQTEILSFEAESTKKKDATKVGVGAGVGAVIGAIAGGGKGAAIGAAVGGGAGTAAVVATRGKELRFDAEHKFTFALSRDVSIKLQ
jgi:hypothetical protein